MLSIWALPLGYGEFDSNMPFHVGAHKPRSGARQEFKFRIKHRLLVAGIGAALTLSGLYKFTHGEFFGENYLRQPVYSTSLIGMGVVVALCALVPSSWLDRTAKRPRSK